MPEVKNKPFTRQDDNSALLYLLMLISAVALLVFRTLERINEARKNKKMIELEQEMDSTGSTPVSFLKELNISTEAKSLEVQNWTLNTPVSAPVVLKEIPPQPAITKAVEAVKSTPAPEPATKPIVRRKNLPAVSEKPQQLSYYSTWKSTASKAFAHMMTSTVDENALKNLPLPLRLAMNTVDYTWDTSLDVISGGINTTVGTTVRSGRFIKNSAVYSVETVVGGTYRTATGTVNGVKAIGSGTVNGVKAISSGTVNGASRLASKSINSVSTGVRKCRLATSASVNTARRILGF